MPILTRNYVIEPLYIVQRRVFFVFWITIAQLPNIDDANNFISKLVMERRDLTIVNSQI